MPPTRALLLVFYILGASAQYPSCNYNSDCSTCLRNQGATSPTCYYVTNCGGSSYCSSFPNSCSYPEKKELTSAAQCPTAPPTIEAAQPLSFAYGLLGLAALAITLTALASHASVEQRCQCCGTRGGKPPPTLKALGLNNHLLFLSACFLWIGLSLGLAAPALPWLVSTTPTFTYTASAFFLQSCQFGASNKEYSLCTQYTLLQYLSKRTLTGDIKKDDLALGQSALDLGVVMYLVLIGLLLPSAAIASVAVHRFNRSTQLGTPAYTSGCSPASLFAAQLLGWPALATFSIVSFIAISVCAAAVARLRLLPPNIYGEPQYAGLPGIVAALVGAALLLVGLVLQCLVARALKDVRGVGCNRGGCCCAPDSDSPGPAPLQGGSAIVVMPQQPQVAGRWVSQTDGKECVTRARAESAPQPPSISSLLTPAGPPPAPRSTWFFNPTTQATAWQLPPGAELVS